MKGRSPNRNISEAVRDPNRSNGTTAPSRSSFQAHSWLYLREIPTVNNYSVQPTMLCKRISNFVTCMEETLEIIIAIFNAWVWVCVCGLLLNSLEVVTLARVTVHVTVVQWRHELAVTRSH
jgi:hypothetical protein